MKKLFRIIIPLLILFLLFLIIRAIYILPSLDGIDPLGSNKIGPQLFVINTDEETVITGKMGTLIWIDKNSFSDCNGNLIQGQIEVKLTEVLTTHDMIMSNIQTTSNGKILESGGMIHIDAFQDGRKLCIVDSCVIGTVIPTNRAVKAMKLYHGDIDNGIVNWQNPIPILSDPEIIRRGEIPEEVLDIYGFENVPFDSISEIEWTIIPDSKYSVEFYDSLYANLMADFSADSQLRYVFETNELGWLNIDKLLQTDKTESVNLQINIINREAFQTIFAKLVLVKEKSVVSGLEFNKGTMVFNSVDSPSVYLPIESNAVIIVTAYRNRKPYYSIKEFIISSDQNIVVELEEIMQTELEGIIGKVL